MSNAIDSPRPGRPPSITRARIADAGIAMGLPAMTFTGVAALLGVSHVALYKHVAHLAALKLLVAEEIFARWQLPAAGEEGLEQYLLRFSASLRQLVKSHPGLAPYLLRRKATTPAMLARIEAHQAQVAHACQLPLAGARWLLSTVAFHCVALADTVYAPAGDAWEAEDDAAVEAEFDLGMQALVIGALAMLER
nr:TetR/AcrR family transcriptional regulator [uncultured Janthinobacterium sp.]